MACIRRRGRKRSLAGSTANWFDPEKSLEARGIGTNFTSQRLKEYLVWIPPILAVRRPSPLTRSLVPRSLE